MITTAIDKQGSDVQPELVSKTDEEHTERSSKIWLLSKKPSAYCQVNPDKPICMTNPYFYIQRRELEELKRLGFDASIKYFEDLTLPLAKEDLPDVARICSIDQDPLLTFHQINILEELDRLGVSLINPIDGIRISDKTSSYLVWNKIKDKFKGRIDMPETIITRDITEAAKFLEKHKEVVFKPFIGSRGIGVKKITYNASNPDESVALLNKLLETDKVLFLQKFIANLNYDIRALVLDGKNLGEYARYSEKMVHNIAQGGKPYKLTDSPINLDAKEIQGIKELAKDLQKTIGLDFVGFDIMPDRNKNLYLIEWNAFPGYKGAETILNRDCKKDTPFCESNIAKEVSRTIITKLHRRK